MTSSTEDSKTIHYSNKNNTTALGIIGQYEELKNNTASKNNNTPQDDSSMEKGEQYSKGDICIVAQTSR